jgi:hypothetical protein
MIKPTAMATIRLLIDRLIIDPDSFRRFRVSVVDMCASRPASRISPRRPRTIQTVSIMSRADRGDNLIWINSHPA